MSSFPKMVTRVTIRMGTMYFTIIAGSSIMPTDRKNTDPKRMKNMLTGCTFFLGSGVWVICWLSSLWGTSGR